MSTRRITDMEEALESIRSDLATARNDIEECRALAASILGRVDTLEARQELARPGKKVQS